MREVYVYPSKTAPGALPNAVVSVSVYALAV